jgi:cell division protein FtsI/penicillin-binding protein 2
LLYRDNWGNPELVIVVYLKYGAWGKESAPIGAQMIKKWREVKQKALKKI